MSTGTRCTTIVDAHGRAQPVGEGAYQRHRRAAPWEQPESTNPYMKGDKVTHAGRTWVSTIDNNVWEPGVYGWEETDG